MNHVHLALATDLILSIVQRYVVECRMKDPRRLCVSVLAVYHRRNYRGYDIFNR